MFKKIAFGAFVILTALAIIFAFHEEKSVTTASDEAYKHYLKGVELIDQFYFRPAMDEFEKAVALDSNFAMAQAALARTYDNLGYRQKAKDLWKVVDRTKDKVTDREQLLIAMREAENNSDRDKAYALAEEYLKKYPDKLEGYTNLAIAEYSKQHWEKAIELYHKALTIDPTNATSYNMLGYLNYYVGRYDDALAMLDKYVELSPNQANPFDSKGEILNAVGRYEEAIASFRQAFNINPDFDFAVLHMADSYGALGELSQQDYCFKLLLTQPPNENKKYNYLLALAKAYSERQEFDSCIALSAKIMKEDPEPEKGNAIGASVYTAFSYYFKRDLPGVEESWKEARKIVEKVAEVRPSILKEGWYARRRIIEEATIADLNGNLEKAASGIGSILDSISIPADKINFRMIYADILRREGNLDQAKSELQKNLSVNPNHVRTLMLLATILENGGDKENADNYRQKALAVLKNADPSFKPLLALQNKINKSVADVPSSKTIHQ